MQDPNLPAGMTGDVIDAAYGWQPDTDTSSLFDEDED